MALPIEDYALIGDTQTAALVGENGAIDWACFPRFDSDATFAALLGDERNGHWALAPASRVHEVRRRYLPGSLVLETEFTTDDGVVQLIDFMPIRGEAPDIIRIVKAIRGRVALRMQLCARFGYGRIIPRILRRQDTTVLVAGPDALYLQTKVPIGRELDPSATFALDAGSQASFVLTWHPSHLPPPVQKDAEDELKSTLEWWQRWSRRGTYRGEWPEAVHRSQAVLKAMTFAPTGGIVAAPTTSLPESLGGPRNWDYRYCWLRDATFTIDALLQGGYHDEARAWREWLIRAVGGDPQQLQVLYGAGGERWLTEREASWLSGYENSRPVRIGNAAESQLQLDVFGELMDALQQARKAGVPAREDAWELQLQLLEHLESTWSLPDKSIWEMRGEPRPFTYSKVMCWVAVDRGIKAIERFGFEGPVEKLRALRSRIHAEVCEKGFDARRGTFVQSFGSSQLDANLLLLPLVGFLPTTDPRIRATIRAIEEELMVDGLVIRYGAETDDGIRTREGAFLACSFWLADNYVLSGRTSDARRLFERLLSLRNDVGLLAEEYDPHARRLVGNFPQAFSHVGLIGTAFNLERDGQHPARRAAD